MNGPRCHICDHEYNQHIQSGCQFTTCICKEFKVKKQEEKVNIQQNSATQNLREKLDKCEMNPDAFKQNLSVIIKEESKQDRQSSQAEIWDKVETIWSKIDILDKYEEYEKVEKEIDKILEIRFENVSAWIKKGHNSINLKKYDEAIFCYNNALILDKKENRKLDKKNYEIFNLLGVAHELNDNHDVAMNFFKDSLKINENFVPAITELGLLYRNLEDYDLAKEQFIKLLQIDHDNVDALDNLGYCYEYEEEYDKAIECYNKSKLVNGKKNGDNYADIRLARCFFYKNDLDHAELLINKDKVTENETEISYEIRGLILRDKEEYDKAILNFENQLKLNPNSVQSWYQIAWCNGMKGSHELALEHYKKYVQLNEDEESSYAIGFELEKLKRISEAKDWYKQELSKYPKSRDIMYNLGTILKKSKEYEEALEIFNKILQIYPEDQWAMMYKSYTLLDMNRFEETLQCIDNILIQDEQKNGPTKAKVMHQKGWSLFKKGELEEGMKWIEKSLVINPEDTEILDSKARIFFGQEKYEEAEKVYEEIFKLEESDDVKESIANCKSFRGNQIENDDKLRMNYCQEAIKIYDSILEKNKTKSSLWFHKGLCFFNLKKYNGALNCQLEAIKINPNDHRIWYELGHIARNHMENYDQAILYFDKSIELNPTFQAFSQKGDLLYKKKEYAQAIDCYNKSLEIKFDKYELHEKSNALHMLKRYSEAIDGYNEVLNIDSEYKFAYTNKSNTLRQMEKYKESLECIYIAQEKFPNESICWYRESSVHEDQKKYEKSLKILKDMLIKFPDEKEKIMKDIKMIYLMMEDFSMVEEYDKKLQDIIDLK